MFIPGQQNVVLSDGTPVRLTEYVDYTGNVHADYLSVIPPKGVTPKAWPTYTNDDGGLLYYRDSGRMIGGGTNYPTLTTKVVEKVDNGDLLKTHGLSVVHINRVGYGRSVTVAFKSGKSTVQIATAITHPDDTFTKKIGTQKAVEAFLAGKVITVPLPALWQGHFAPFVKTLFEVC
jgi:hypothetical protein